MYIDIKVDRQLFHIIPYTYTVCILYNDVIYCFIMLRLVVLNAYK